MTPATDTMLAVTLIRTNGGTQARELNSTGVIDDYADAMRAGAVFPPVVVYFDGAIYWLADGFHRVIAARQAGIENIAADVRMGIQRDAVLYACGANSVHGLRRTNADKQRSVRTLLDDAEWGQWSDNEIARRCSVSQPFVSGLRPKPPYNGYKGDERKHTRKGTTVSQKPKQPKPKPASLAPEQYACGDCGATFHDQVWHCPGCQQHWATTASACAVCTPTVVDAPTAVSAPEPPPTDAPPREASDWRAEHGDLIGRLWTLADTLRWTAQPAQARRVWASIETLAAEAGRVLEGSS